MFFSVGRTFTERALLLSMLAHVVLFIGLKNWLPHSEAVREPVAVKVRIAEPPQAVVRPTPAPVLPTPSARPTPRPVVRVDKRQPVPKKPQQPPEVRAGLSDSTAKPGTERSTAPAIAVGNSSLAEVNPADANKPPPPPLAATEETFSEAVADAPAQCPVPPNLELTTDALNAGLTNAEVVIEVAIASSGVVQTANLKTGTGFDIDKLALKTALKLRCRPALLAGRPVGVTGKKLVWKVIYD
ncbi:hypothetical protein EBU99_04905 [bacterium]|nr:hypothetical protein [bacterium]